MELRELTNEEFNSFIENYEISSNYQTTEYALTMNNQNYEPEYVGLFNDNNEIVAGSLILIEKISKTKLYAYAPRGFLIDYSNFELLSEFTKQLKIYLKKKKVMAIKISPMLARSKYTPSTKIKIDNPKYDECFNNLKNLKYYHLGYNNFFESYKPRFEAVTTLQGRTSEEIFNLMDGTFKQKILACDLAGIRVYKGSKDNLDYVYEELREKRTKSMEYIKDLYNNFSKSNKIDVFFAQLETKVFLVNTQIEYQKQINVCSEITDMLFKSQGQSNNDLINRKIQEDNKLANLKNQLVYATNLLRDNPNGIMLACVMAIKQRNKVYLTLDGLNEEYKHLCPKHLLIWKVIENFSKEGVIEIHIGGITNPTYVGENKYKETTDFRLGFNADAIEYAGDFELVTRPIKYMFYRNTALFRRNKKEDK